MEYITLDDLRIVPNDEQYAGQKLYICEIGHCKPSKKRIVGPWSRPVYGLHYVINGSGSYCGTPVKKGDTFFINCNQVHSFTDSIESPMEYYWILFKGSDVSDILSKYGIREYNCVINSCYTEKSAEIIKNAIYNGENVCRTPYFTGIFWQLISYQCTITNNMSVYGDGMKYYIDKAIHYINLYYCSIGSIEEISKYLNISHNYLCRLFIKNMGMTAKNYLTSVRIKNAEYLLTKIKDISIKEVAHSVGFKDSQYFSKVFYRCIGVSPSEYRRI